MAKLFWRFGPMNSGKSTALLQVAHNYRERDGRPVICKPSTDTKHPHVLSRLGVSEPVDIELSPSDSPYASLLAWEEKFGRASCALVDEAQFLTPVQVDEFFLLTVRHNLPVIAYGIRTDFQSHLFPGSQRLMELAHSLEELKTVCRCGRKALFNARKDSSGFLTSGDAVAIDGEYVTYEALCGQCYLDKVGPLSAE